MTKDKHSSLRTLAIAMALFVVGLPGIASAFDPYGAPFHRRTQ
jgi:hypothetical protein